MNAPLVPPGRTLTAIAAYASKSRIIGAGPEIPWRSSADFAHFKATTIGHTIVMGRATFDSIGRPLPGRRTIVLTRDAAWSHPSELVSTASNLAGALEQAFAGDGSVFIVGGGQVYTQAMPHLTHQILTEVNVDADGDVHYPEFSADEWVEAARDHRRDLSPALDWVWWERR